MRKYNPEDYLYVFTTLNPYLGGLGVGNIDVEGFLKDHDLLTSMVQNALNDYSPIMQLPPGSPCVIWFLECTPEMLKDFGVTEYTDISDMTLEWFKLPKEMQIKLIAWRNTFKSLSFVKPLTEKQYL